MEVLRLLVRLIMSAKFKAEYNERDILKAKWKGHYCYQKKSRDEPETPPIEEDSDKKDQRQRNKQNQVIENGFAQGNTWWSGCQIQL